mgnify:CR=1 FL=1
MIVHVIEKALLLNPKQIYIVVGKHKDIIIETVKKYITDQDKIIKIIYVDQDKSLGTGHAIMCASEILSGQTIVAYADTLIRAKGDLELDSDATIWVKKVDNPEDTLFLFYPDDSKVGIKPIRKYLERMEEDNVKVSIIVVKESITSFAKQALPECEYRLEYFKRSEEHTS